MAITYWHHPTDNSLDDSHDLVAVLITVRDYTAHGVHAGTILQVTLPVGFKNLLGVSLPMPVKTKAIIPAPPSRVCSQSLPELFDWPEHSLRKAVFFCSFRAPRQS